MLSSLQSKPEYSLLQFPYDLILVTAACNRNTITVEHFTHMSYVNRKMNYMEHILEFVSSSQIMTYIDAKM